MAMIFILPQIVYLIVSVWSTIYGVKLGCIADPVVVKPAS